MTTTYGSTRSQRQNRTTKPTSVRSTTMYLIHEDLARAQIRERLDAAHRRRRAVRLQRARRLSRIADLAAEAARRAESRLF